MNDSPAIYVACLASYSAGKLHGCWIHDVEDKDEDDILEEIEAMLEASPEPNAEEWAIHDHSGFAGFRVDEREKLHNVVAMAELLEEFGDVGVAASNIESYDPINAKQLCENFCGCYGSIEDYAEQYLSDTGQLDKLDESLRRYFDYEYYGRDLETDGDIVTHRLDGDLYIFHSC